MKSKHIALFVFALILSSNSLFSQDLKRMEPLNWWVGMEHSQVQIMLYGDKIATLKPHIKELTILSEIRTENPNYLFITVETKNKKAGTYPICLSNAKGKKVIEKNFELKERRAGSANRTGFDASDVIYLLMPDRFANGNPQNDSHPDVAEKANRSLPGGRHGGDIEGIIKHLDYIKDLGATAIWSTPLLEDNDSVFSYHTYGQSDLYRVDPRYGTNDDYRRLVEEAHKRQLKIIKDVVPNHWGQAHWMMADLPTYDWIHQFPGYAQTNYRSSTQMDPNKSDYDFKLCVDGWFVRSMPDINQGNVLAYNYLVQNTIWWIEYADLDGIRVDTYPYNDKEKVADWTRAVMTEYPHINIVGEVWLHDQAQISYWQKDSPIGALQSFNSFMPSVMDFTFHDAVGMSFGESDAGWDRGMFRFYENLVNDFLYADPNNLMIFLENHDTERFNHKYPNFNAYRLAMVLLATHRGIPQIYYGSEIGMAGDKGKGDADIRQDFPGGWSNDSNNAFSEAGRTQKQNEYHNLTKLLLNWRQTSKAVHFGKTVQFLPHDNVFVYFRILNDEVVMVVINNSDKKHSLKLSRFAEILKDFRGGKEILSGSQVSFSDVLDVDAKSAMIFELNP
jgi:glycosidase